MKACLYSVLFFAASLFFISSLAPSTHRVVPDSSEYFLQKDDLISYFRWIKASADSAQRNNQLDELKNISQLALHSFRKMDRDEKDQLRSTCMYLGSYIKNTGDYNEALKYYLVAHQNVSDSILLDSNSWFVENVLGHIYTRLGDHEKSMSYYLLTERSLTHYNEFELLSRLYTNIGISLRDENKIDEAIYYYEKGLYIADSTQYKNGVFSNHLNLCEIYLDQNQIGLAQWHANEAVLALDSLKNDKKYIEKQYVIELNYGEINKKLKNYPQSIHHYYAAIHYGIEFYKNQNRREFAKLYTSMAETYLLMDSLAAAEWVIGKGIESLIPEYIDYHSLPLSSQLFRENSFIRLFDLRSRLFEKKYMVTGDTAYLGKAIEYVQLALDANDLFRNPIIMDASKLLSINGHKVLINNGVEWLYQLYQKGNEEIYFGKARLLFTRSKGILFSEKSKRSFVTDEMTESERKALTTLEEKTLNLYSKKWEKNAEINSINVEILKAKEQTNQVFKAYEKKRTAKAPHSDYIEYCVTDSYLYSLSSIGGHSQFVQLGRKSTFDSLLVKFNSYVELKNLNTNDTILRQLDKILIEPVSEVLPDRIVLIPEGDIGLVPFEMLKNACGNYRIEESAISYMYQYEPYMYENLKGTKKSAIFCLAPNYGTKSGEDPEVSRGLLYSLPYAKNEIDSIYRLFGWGSRRSESGDKKEWLKNIRATKIFHYAGHAVVRKDQAYLALSNSIDKPSQLTDSEFGQLHNPLDMVVLSACETGLGKFESGEGIRSLGRSFMEAGAAASIYSLWSINDRSTASFMSSFYKYLQKGMRKDEALRQCKLDFILHSSKFRHPYYWAAFIGAGDMEPLEIKNKRWMIIGGLCIFMMLLIAFALYFSKNK